MTHCSYGGGMMISVDAKDSGVMFPAAKRQRQRRGREALRRALEQLEMREEEYAMEKDLPGGGGWIAIYSGRSALTDIADPTARIARLSELNGRILWRKSRGIPTFRKIGTPSSENKLIERER